MTRVVLQPAGDEYARLHYVDTVENPVPLLRLAEFLPSNEVDALQAIYEGRPVPTWGVTPGEGGVNHRKWERLSVGDVVLLARDGVLFVSGVVTFKAHNRRLALDLWKTDDDGDTWEYLYFLDDLRPQSIPQAN